MYNPWVHISYLNDTPFRSIDSEVSRDDQNYVFREFECGFAREQNFVLKVRESTGWSKGKAIPPECKRLMRVAKGRELSNHSDWFGFVMKHDRFESPTGKLISTQGILVGSALIEIESELEIKTSTTLLKIARNLKNLMS
ncbi:regulator [Vibrio cholerae]|uniref:regulator n=1 Tax=Vibrio cholerae TaxID=666 RepID=UPI001F079C6D|nr:regulator [Vibrio cholerae]